MKNIYYTLVSCLIVISCKSQQLNLSELDSHIILERTLNEIYKGKDKSKTINLEIYTREIDSSKLDNYIHTLKLLSRDDPTFQMDTLWLNDFNDFNKLIEQNTFSQWDSTKLSIENLNTQFQIRQKENQRYLKEKIERDSLDDRKAYEMKVVYWVKENRTYNILSATPVIFSKNGEKAILLTSIYHKGLTAWLFDKIDGIWKLKLQKEVAFY